MHPSELELRGLSHAEVQEATNTHAKHIKLRVESRAQLRATVDYAYVDDIPLVSEAAQKQAQRTAVSFRTKVRRGQDPILGPPSARGEFPLHRGRQGQDDRPPGSTDI